MAIRPSTFPTWTAGEAAYVTEPPTGQRATGWLADQHPPFSYMNWIHWLTNEWLEYLDDVRGGWPTFLVGTEVDFASALDAVSLAGGGVISVLSSFDITDQRVVPPNTVVVGRQGESVLNFSVSGDPKIDLEGQCELRNVYFTSDKTSGDLVRMLGDSSRIHNCKFTVNPDDSLVCVNVTGDACGVRDSVFDGVLGGSAIGIEFDAGSSDGFEQDNTFLP